MARDNDTYNNNWVFLTRDGLDKIGGEYSEIQVLDGFELYENPVVIAVEAGSNNVSIMHCDGELIETGYRYEEYNSDYKLIEVSKEAVDGLTLYNYIDMNGELVFDRWTIGGLH